MVQSYRTRSSRTTAGLRAAHRRMLYDESGIDPEVVDERGVRTIRSGRELPRVYSWRQKQRAPGVLFTIHRPSGQTCTVFRPDKLDPKNRGHKYEQECKHYGGSGNVLDVHPSNHHLIDRTDVPVLYVEGIKKADAITSAARVAETDFLAVAISGVYNFLTGGEPISDMYDIVVEGRRVYICFDSDMLRNPNVQDAAERLAEHLASRGADVWIVYLPDQPDGSKTGADDFLVAGGTLEEILELARPFDPRDLQREKLSRNEKLSRAFVYLTRRGEELPAKSRRDCSKRATWRACLTLAEKRGKLVEDGIQIIVPSMTGAEIAAMSQPTFSACMTDLVEDGLMRRIKRQRSEHADSYVLLLDGGVDLYNDGGGARQGSQGEKREPHRGYKVIPPLPEMRWSSPGRKPRRGVVKGTRRVRQGPSLTEEILSKRRPGKKRAEIVRYLVENGGAATREELLERFGGLKTRWRDFKKQTLADLLGHRRQYQDQPLSVGPPVIELTDDGVRLVPEWLEALEEHRIIGEEQEAAVKQKVDHLRQRAAYRKRNETKAEPAPIEEEMAQRREARRKRREAERLVYEGMSCEFATEAAIGADGFIEDLRPAEDPAPPPLVAEEHRLDCECLVCSATMPRYATVGQS